MGKFQCLKTYFLFVFLSLRKCYCMKKVKTKIWRKIFLSINFIVQEVLIDMKIFFEGENIIGGETF